MAEDAAARARCLASEKGSLVQERLGHATIPMTLDLYSHVTSDMQRLAADALEAAIGGTAERIA
jgi:integrase